MKTSNVGLVSVVMCAFNAEKFIGDAIQSIITQTYKNWELIIVDDLSVDNTRNIIGKFLNGRNKITLLCNRQNLGSAESANIGLRQAKGEYIARLDADDISETLRFEKQVAFLNNNPDIAMIGSAAYLIDDMGNKYKRINVLSRNHSIKKFISHVNPFIHSSIMIRKTIIEDIGGYREKFRNAQDYDLCLRLGEKYNMANLSENLVCWRTHKNSTTMQHAYLQKAYADIARNMAKERKWQGYDNYDSIDFNIAIDSMINKHHNSYQSENGIYKIAFTKQYKEGTLEFTKGLIKFGIPVNSLYRIIIQLTSHLFPRY